MSALTKVLDFYKCMAVTDEELATYDAAQAEFVQLCHYEAGAELNAKEDAEQEARIQTLTRLLERCEWVIAGPSMQIGVCPICDAFGEIPTHKPDCPLAAALKEQG